MVVGDSGGRVGGVKRDSNRGTSSSRALEPFTDKNDECFADIAIPREIP